MNKNILLALVFFGLGILSAHLMSADQRTPVPAGMTQLSAQQATQSVANTEAPAQTHSLREIAAQLATEKTARIALEAKLQELTNQVARLSQSLPDNEAHAIQNQAQASTQAAADPVDFSGQQSRASILSEYGFSSERIAQIKTIADEQELARLYLRDQAIREDWLNTPRYRDAQQELTQNARSVSRELGDNDYDRYLYAMGLPNRIQIARVMQESPAAKAGIRAGDIIRSYDNKAIFTWDQVRQATTTGQTGSTVRIELERDGALLSVYIPVGPLGVELGTQRQAPK